MTGLEETGSEDFAQELDLGRTGFHGRDRFATLTNAIAATFAVVSLSLCLVVALTALSIKVISI